MKPLEEQFAEQLEPLLEKVKADIPMRVAHDIKQAMFDNVDSGRAFGKDRYDRDYKPYTKRDRKRGGFQIGHTDLQREQKRVKRVMVDPEPPDGVKLSFEADGHIFYHHHHGVEYPDNSVRVRSIWPKEDESVPPSITNRAHRRGQEILMGKT